MDTVFCISVFAKILKRAIGYKSNLSVYKLLFLWAIDKGQLEARGDYLIDIDDSYASELNTRKVDLYEKLQDYLLDESNFKHIEAFFLKDVIPKFVVDRQRIYCEYIETALKDDGLLEIDRDRLEKYYSDISTRKDEAKYLAYLFYVAASRPNAIKCDFKPEDLDYLIEVNFLCPITGNDLIVRKKKKTIYEYKIIKIYPENPTLFDEFDSEAKPEDMNDSSNLIAVHLSAAGSYEAYPTVETYTKLKKKKEDAKRSKNQKEIQRLLNNAFIPEQLSLVVKRLQKLPDEIDGDYSSNYKAYRVEEKVHPEFVELIGEIKGHVSLYRKKIWHLLLANEKEKILDSETISNQMRATYSKLRNTKFTDLEIYEELSKWLCETLGLEDKYLSVCRILVSFFVQNCEVFDVIPK